GALNGKAPARPALPSGLLTGRRLPAEPMSEALEIDDEPGVHELRRMRASFDARLAWLRRACWRFCECSGWRLTAEQARETEKMVLATFRSVVVDRESS